MSEPKGLSPLDLAALLAQYGPLAVKYLPAIYALVEQVLGDLGKKQAAYAAAPGCPADKCACDCLDAQLEALVSAVAHNLHLKERCGGC